MLDDCTDLVETNLYNFWWCFALLANNSVFIIMYCYTIMRSDIVNIRIDVFNYESLVINHFKKNFVSDD